MAATVKSRGAGVPLLLLLLLSCSARVNSTRIEFWGLGREGEVVAELVPQFEKETGIHVDVQQIPWTAAHEKLLTAHVGNSLPDVAQIGNTWIPELSTLHAITPLNGYLQRGVVPRADFFQGIFETNVVGNTVYGIPWYVDTRVLFYRTDMIPTPPRTWSEWIAVMERVKRESKDPHFFPLLMPTNEWPQPVILAMQRGATFVDDAGHARFDEPNFVAAFSFYLDIYKRGLAPVMSNSQIANLYQQFGDGDFAMFVSGPWDVGNLRTRLKPEQQKTWSVAPLPAPDGKPWPGVSMSGGSSLVISRSTEKKEAAWKFIEFLSRPDIQVRFSQLSGDLPARRSAWSTPELQNDREMQAFRVQLDHTAALPRIPEIENICTTIFEHGQLATRGQFDAREGARRLNAKVERMLEKRRWVLARERDAARAARDVAGFRLPVAAELRVASCELRGLRREPPAFREALPVASGEPGELSRKMRLLRGRPADSQVATRNITATRNPQPETRNPKHATRNPQHATRNTVPQ